MQLISALKDLGFSFWQVVVVLVVLLFRKEIRQTLDRLKSFKVAGSELSLGGSDVGLVREIKKLESEAAGKLVTVDELRDELAQVLRRRCITALIHIRGATSILWPSLKKLTHNQSTLHVDIRLDTYREIESSLRLLSAAGMFEFSTMPSRQVEGLQKLFLSNIHPLFRSLIQEAESF